MIVKSGSKWLVKTEDGSRTLGTHSTKASAARQLRAIEWSKHKNDKPKKRIKHPSKKDKK